MTVTIGGQTYTTVLDAAGNWSVGVPASVISGLSDGSVTVTASVTDAAGNTGTGTHNVTVDTGLPSVAFNAISDDNVLNAVEKVRICASAAPAPTAEGTVVAVTLNGKTTWPRRRQTAPEPDRSGGGSGGSGRSELHPERDRHQRRGQQREQHREPAGGYRAANRHHQHRGGR